MEQTKLKRFTRILFIILLSICTLGGLCYAYNYDVEETPTTPIIKVTEPEVIDTISTQDSIRDALICEVQDYLKKQSPNSHKFIPKYIVYAGLTHDIDICFMMAQTQIETNYGTMGAGRECSRRSLFGVAIRRYGDYETAINDYCILLKKSYIGKGRTEKHLMTKYVTHGGARYASNPNYEKDLQIAYNNIKKETNIYNLQNEWRESF